MLAGIADSSITGGCACGGVRYELAKPPARATYCHCTRCQRRTGTAASAQARVEPGTVQILRGEDLVRYWTPEDGFTKSFCSACGGALFSKDEQGRIRSVRLGTFDANPGVRPSHRAYVAYAASWEPIPEDGLPRYDEAAPN